MTTLTAVQKARVRSACRTLCSAGVRPAAVLAAVRTEDQWSPGLQVAAVAALSQNRAELVRLGVDVGLLPLPPDGPAQGFTSGSTTLSTSPVVDWSVPDRKSVV